MKFPGRLKIALSLILLICAVSIAIFIKDAGTWTIVQNPEPERIDIIFTFGGEFSREQFAFDLLMRHKDALWIASNPQPQTTALVSTLPKSRFVPIRGLRNTWDEVNYIVSKSSSRKNEKITIALVSGP